MTTATMAVNASANELYGLVGANIPMGAYQPVNVGKMSKARTPGKTTRTMIQSLTKLNFQDTEGFRALSPENVYTAIPSFTDQNGNIIQMDKFRAVVGEQTNVPYSVMTNMYTPVQHGEVIKTVADTIDELGLRVVGTCDVSGGKMYAHAYLLGPQFSFDLMEDVKKNIDNGTILGVKAFNSHMGNRGFGLEFFGIRTICSNYMAFGNVLGRVYWTHKATETEMMDGYKNLLRGVITGIPAMQKAMSEMNGEELYIDEATAMLYGIGFQEANVDAIISNLGGLVPEANLSRPTKFDVYNASTAYISHKVTGGMDSHLQYSDNIERMIGSKTSKLLDKGFDRMKIIAERKKAKELKITSASQIRVVDV